MQKRIQYGSKIIAYTVKRVVRKTLSIQVHPDQQVVVIAPSQLEDTLIAKKLKAKAPWILKKQQYFASFHPRNTERKFVNGESHLYLGRQYKLKIKKSKETSVKVFQGIMQVETGSIDKDSIARLLDIWYRERAELIFNTLLEKLLPKFSRYKISKPVIAIRKMNTRWGSCTPSGKIILNPILIKAPKSCIEYVIIHELAHLVYRNHSQKFYTLLNKLLPDWGKQKVKLEYLLA